MIRPALNLTAFLNGAYSPQHYTNVRCDQAPEIKEPLPEGSSGSQFIPVLLYKGLGNIPRSGDAAPQAG